MLIPARKLLGVGRIPADRTASSRWLRERGVPISVLPDDGRKPEAVRLSDLPEPERLAYLERACEEGGLPAGSYDDAAHAAFLAAPASLRVAAERRAAIARYLLTIRAHVGWPERLAMVRAKFGAKGVSKPSLKRLLADVKGVDPINFAPALLPGYRSATPLAPVPAEAWSFFMTTIRDAGPAFPLKQAWRDVRDVAKVRGWDWPSFPTIYRRWAALPEAQKLAARHGREAAVRALAMPVMRDKGTLRPLALVSLDGRTLDLWADFGDGKAVRPVMLALVDVASNYVLGYELARSENAVATSRLIRNVCREFGIFDTLYTDNGSAFCGHLVAGGTDFKWRGKRRAKPGVKPLGVCHHLGIDLTFALPKNAQAKIVERTFATLSRVVDDRPEFRGAHTGHQPGATPTTGVVPVPIAVVEAVIRREIQRHNCEAGRRGAGARGRSYEAMFRDGLAERVVRKPTTTQLHFAGLIYKPASVDRWGRVQVDTWTYGDSTTQAALKPWHKKGQILIGRDPDDFEAPAVAFDEADRLISDRIMPVKQGVYDSVEGAREAEKNRKAGRDAVAQGEKANTYLADAEMKAALADLSTPDADHPQAEPAKVVGAHFGPQLRPMRKARAVTDPNERSAVPDAMLENFDRRRGIDWSRYGG